MKDTKELFNALPDGPAQVKRLMAARRRQQRSDGRGGYAFPRRVPKLRGRFSEEPTPYKSLAWPPDKVAVGTAEYVDLFCRLNHLTKEG